MWPFFQKFMDNISRDFQDEIVSYMDDILVISKIVDEQEKCLNQVLAAIKRVNLIINLEKCQMRKCEIDFLGFTINKSGVCPIQKTLHAL